MRDLGTLLLALFCCAVVPVARFLDELHLGICFAWKEAFSD